MDNPHNRPRVASYHSSVHGSATMQGPTNFGYSHMPAPKPIYTGQRVIPPSETNMEDEYRLKAKQYRRSRIKNYLMLKLFHFSLLLGFIVIVLAGLGLFLNFRYAGKALPYTYIGEISVGGLTEYEIKSALDLRAKETMITFTEGGLTYELKPAYFSTNFDTEKAAKDAMVGFNPFNYLIKRNFVVPVEIDENQVDGFIQLKVADKQTVSVNAEIVIGKDELTLVPEKDGFRTSTAYVVAEVKKQMSEMKDPVVSLSAEYDKPAITQADLQDDYDNANRMINTDAGFKVWNSKIAPSKQDKLSWLKIRQVNGSNSVIVEFDQAKVREYVFGLADKYSAEPEDEAIVNNEDGSQSIKPGKNGRQVKDIDKMYKSFYEALTNKQNRVINFDFEYTPYKTIDRQGLNLRAAPQQEEEDEDAGNSQESTQGTDGDDGQTGSEQNNPSTTEVQGASTSSSSGGTSTGTSSPANNGRGQSGSR